MSLWHFVSTLEGWRRAYGADETIQPPSAEEFMAWKEGIPLNAGQ